MSFGSPDRPVPPPDDRPDRKYSGVTPPCWLDAESMRPFLMHQRVEVLIHLARGPIRVCDLANEVKLGDQQISQYLGPLHRAGLVRRTVCGRSHVYALTEAASLRREGDEVEIKLTLRACHLVIRVTDPSSDLTPRLQVGGDPPPPPPLPPSPPTC